MSNEKRNLNNDKKNTTCSSFTFLERSKLNAAECMSDNNFFAEIFIKDKAVEQ